MTTDRVAPNPTSPYATANPAVRHIVPSIFGIAPRPGSLTTAACGYLAVVPTEALRPADEGDLPDGMCTACVTVVNGGPLRDDRPRTECETCGSTTRHGRWCALCRQDHHDEHTAAQQP